MATVLKAELQFGIVGVRVRLEKSSDTRSNVTFNRLHKTCKKDPKGLVGQKNYCKDCGEEVPNSDDIGKAYTYQKGKHIEVDEAAIDNLKVPTNGAIQLVETVEESWLADNLNLLTGHNYFLPLEDPDNTAQATAYANIREGLQGHIATGRVSLYSREHTVAVKLSKHGFMMYLLRYSDEMRAEPHQSLPQVVPAYVKLVTQIVEAIKVEAPKVDYKDQLKAGTLTYLQNQLAGLPQAVPTAPPAPVVVVEDLTEQLRQSLALYAKKQKPALEETELPAEKKPAKKSRKKAVA